MINNRAFLAALAVLGMGSQGAVLAQNETDALRYSQLQFGGTARIQGIAGAQTALGGDIGNMAGNPAGLGFYRRSDISITPALTFGSTDTEFLGTASSDNKDNFNISSFGLVFTNYKGDGYEGDWRSFSFGIGFNRQAHFHNRFNYSGFNDRSSIVESFALNSQGISEQEFLDEIDAGLFSEEGLAYYNFLTNYGYSNPSDSTSAVVPVPIISGGDVQQSEKLTSKGAQSQLDFTFATNYRDKLFLGGTLGIPSVRYRQERTFREENKNNPSPFQNLSYTDEFKTTGGGLNLKIGAIYKPAAWVNIGASIQTPTILWLTDTYGSWMDVNYSTSFVVPAPGTDTVGAGNYYGQTVPGTFDYSLTTPFRAQGGLAFFVGSSGFLSADVEYVNYSQAHFSADETFSTFNGPNNEIERQYQSAINVRVGGEYRYEIFRLRAGYANYGDPYATGSEDRARTYYTAGAGLRLERFYLDLSYVHSSYNSVYQPYSLGNTLAPAAINKNTYNSFLVTVGTTF